jgi:hypothetical protein
MAILRRVSASADWTGNTDGTFTNILSARASFGFDKRVSEASIVTPIRPGYVSTASPGITYDDAVTLTMGVVGSNVSVRFIGFVRDFRYSHNPKGVETICRGLLTRAEEYENWEDPQLFGGLMIEDLLGAPTGTAPDIVKVVLNRAGVSFTDANIQGSSTVYGDIDEVFIWHNGNSDNPLIDLQEAGETALGYIERYDAIDADFSATTGSGGRYRTFETLGGTIYRYMVGGRPRATEEFTFTETVDILDGNFERSISDTRNYFVVTGYDPGDNTGPESFTLQGSNTFQPSSSKHTYRFSSPMIERSTEAQSGTGMSCERLANVLALEFNREIVSGWITTHRDDDIGIAQTHLVQAPGGLPGRLGVAEKLWVQSLDISVDEQGFTQRISYLGGGLPDDDLPVPPSR